MNLLIESIVFDAGTQVRAAINEDVVASYAERMEAGDAFPPVVVFHDGNRYYLADGFHRTLAAKRNGLVEIPADVTAGTQRDALWFALGANKANGQRLTDDDKAHAIRIAIETWPEKMQREIASQVGCSQGFVSKVSADMPMNTGRTLRRDQRVDAVKRLVDQGLNGTEIAAHVGISRQRVSEIKTEIGVASELPDKSRAAVQQRKEDMRSMAGKGYATPQIAAALGLSEGSVRNIAAEAGIVIHADRTMSRTHRHDPDRIVGQIVMDASNLSVGLELVDFADLDRTQIAGWISELETAKKNLVNLIRRLQKEQTRHEAA